MEYKSKKWNHIYNFSLGWLIVITGLLIYDTCSMWLGYSGVEFLQPNHRLKTALLTFPMLGIYCVASSQKKRNA